MSEDLPPLLGRFDDVCPVDDEQVVEFVAPLADHDKLEHVVLGYN
ncbi:MULTISPECIES: hypothetical protein [Ramlibacter]|nr:MULTISPECIES: hypothetical protein [Ramlibacter]